MLQLDTRYQCHGGGHRVLHPKVPVRVLKVGRWMYRKNTSSLGIGFTSVRRGQGAEKCSPYFREP